MKPDVAGRGELEKVLTVFYSSALNDAVIGHFFTQVVPLDLSTHLPVITDFWESVVFGTRGYQKNVMELHRHIHDLSAIRKEHLDRWVELFTSAVHDHYEGPNALLMIQRARSIATMMDLKLNYSGIGKMR